MRVRPTGLFLLLFFGSTAWAAEPITVGADDWPWWRGPTRDGHAAPGQEVVTTWSSTKNVLWKTAIPGRGHGSATVVGDHVYLVTAERKRQTQSVICLDRMTGKQLWKTDVHKGGFTGRVNQKASMANSTPACDGQRVFVNFYNGNAAWTTALSRDGTKLWQTKITDYRIHQAYASSPNVYKDMLLVSADNKRAGALAALDRVSGRIVWKIKRDSQPNYPSPVVLTAAGREQLIMIGTERVSSFDPNTGERIWEVKGATKECVTSTVTNGELVYSSGGWPKNHVVAHRADGTGEVVWSNSVRIYVPSMIIHKGHLFAINGAGIAYCWDAATGKEAWKARLSKAGFSASPVLVGDRLYAIDEAGTAHVLEADPKQFKVIATNRMGDDAFATPTICGGRIYLRVGHDQGGRQEMLYCIGTR
ncbi:MAG: PQQ-binding-like beta-propeller repeat protein [Phycisphaerae bacterium]|nr:PQQ-binding-like beta-propeller repeat protein [Phycisphaerae bacterium]